MTDEGRRALDLLGLAARAGEIAPGTERVREAVRAGRARFAFVASDASANSRDKLVPLLVKHGIPCTERFDRSGLGAAIGRAPVSAVAVLGQGIAGRLRLLFGDVAPAEQPRRRQ
ncbi:MAG: L7Ae/L30e/S12e/Gadd45 family ribosomal protein [Longimicrobiales bacterium]